MHHKKYWLCGIFLGFIGILFLFVSCFLLCEKKDSSFSTGNYICRLKVNEYQDYTTYYIQRLEVQKGRLMQSTSIEEMIFFQKDVYEEYKNNLEFMKNKDSSDPEMKITFQMGNVHDYTKDSDQEELIYPYEDYQFTMKQQGYLCQKEK